MANTYLMTIINDFLPPRTKINKSIMTNLLICKMSLIYLSLYILRWSINYLSNYSFQYLV